MCEESAAPMGDLGSDATEEVTGLSSGEKKAPPRPPSVSASSKTMTGGAQEK